MENQKSPMLVKQNKLSAKFRPRYLVKRFDDEEIEISEETRNAIIDSMAKGDRFIQIGHYTLMVNGIKSIDPKYGKKNIPPSPELGDPEYRIWLEVYHADRVEEYKRLVAELEVSKK